MAPARHLPEDEKQQHEFFNETIQSTGMFYTPAASAITDLPPDYPTFQSNAWEPQTSDEADMIVPRSWETKRIIDNHGPTMFDWYPGSVEPWVMQHQTPDFTSPPGQIMTFQPPQISSEFQNPPLKFEKSFGWEQDWQPNYRAQEISPITEVVPQLWNGPGTLAGNPEVSDEADSHGRASKRRRRSSTSSMDVRFAPPTIVAMQPSSVECAIKDQALGQFSHAPISTLQVAEYIQPAFEGSPPSTSLQVDNTSEVSPPMASSFQGLMPTVEVTQLPLTPVSEASPILTPSVRVISDRRDSAGKLRRGDDTPFKTQSANTKRGHYASEVWESHKPVIKKMYIDEGKPLREVISTMEKEHNFPATQRMYKARFKQWGFVKNNTEKVVSQILRTKFERDAAGKLSQFTRNGKNVNLQNYLQRKGLTEYDLVDFHPAADVLPHVRCRTPPFDIPEDLRLPDRLRFQDTLVLSFKRAFLLWRQEDQENAFGFQPSVFTWRVTDFPHLSSLIESAQLIRKGDGAKGVAALNQAFWSMNTYLASMDATASFYFFFHRQSRPWQDDARIALAVWKFLAAYASTKNHNNHPLFNTFRLMYEVVQKEGVTGLRELLMDCSDTVADELEKAFGKEHWLKDLIWHRCFPEKSKLRHLQLIRDLRDHGPAKKIVTRLY